MFDLSDHPFSPENVARESGASDYSLSAWLCWCDKAEKLFGHDLDGNDVDRAGCGYSIDEANTAFMADIAPARYVEIVKSRARYQGEWKGRA